MPIGFFDSGVGGLSVLKEALKIMPNENYIYFGDSKNAPYGVKDFKEVKALTYEAVEFLLSKGAKGLVIACNTATSAAVAALRVTYPKIPIVGIEPAVKPAVKLKRPGKIIIMATPVTLKLEKFHKLLDLYKDEAEIIPMPCAGLMEFVEAGNINGKETVEYLKEKFAQYNKNDIASIVLGCTHYPFIKKEILEEMPGVTLIDGSVGVAKEVKRQLEEHGLLNDERNRTITVYNSLTKEEKIFSN